MRNLYAWLYAGILFAVPIMAGADYNATQGTGTIIRALDAAHGGSSLCAAASTQCSATVIISAAGADIGTQQASDITAIRAGVTSAIPSCGTLASCLTIGGVFPVAAPQGGATISSVIAPATPAGVNLKSGATTLYGIQATTIQATPVYLKIYNATSATCGSGTPVGRWMIPAASTAANGAGSNIPLPPMGIALGTGLSYCVTGNLADNDTTAITVANTLVNFQWN